LLLQAMGAAGKAGPTGHGTITNLNEMIHEDHAKTLDRVEFLYALVHLAIDRYVNVSRDGVASVSAAVRRLLEEDITATIGPSLSDPNEFRLCFAYTDEVDRMLRRYFASLRTLFDGVISFIPTEQKVGSRGLGTSGPVSRTLMRLDVWMRLLDGLKFLGNGDVTERHGAVCFAWSRLCVVDGRTGPGRLRETHLSFEDFLEALCRLCIIKALPTDAEIEAAGCGGDAGLFMVRLAAGKIAGVKHATFVATHRGEWGDLIPRNGEGNDRRLEKLIHVMLRMVETASASAASAPSEQPAAVVLTREMVLKWVKTTL